MPISTKGDVELVAAQRWQLAVVLLGSCVWFGCSGIEREYHAETIPLPLADMPFKLTDHGITVAADPVVEEQRQSSLFDADLIGIGVVPMRVFIVNGTATSLFIRPSDMRLEWPDGTQVNSVGVYAVLSKLERERLWSWLGNPPNDAPPVTADTGKTDEALQFSAMVAMGALGAGAGAGAAAIAGAGAVTVAGSAAVGGLVAAGGIGTAFQNMDEIARGRAVRKGEYLKKQLPDRQLGPNQSVHGFLYFILPREPVRLSEATFSLWSVNSEEAIGLRIRLPLQPIQSDSRREFQQGDHDHSALLR